MCFSGRCLFDFVFQQNINAQMNLLFKGEVLSGQGLQQVCCVCSNHAVKGRVKWCKAVYHLSGVEPVVGDVTARCSFQGAHDSLGHGLADSRLVVRFLHRDRWDTGSSSFNQCIKATGSSYALFSVVKERPSFSERIQILTNSIQELTLTVMGSTDST